MATVTIQKNHDKAFPFSLVIDGVEIARVECAELAEIMAKAPGLADTALRIFEDDAQ